MGLKVTRDFATSIIMVSFSSLLALCSAAAVLAAPSNVTHEPEAHLVRRTTVSSSSTGTVDGYYYSLYMEDNGGVTMNIGTGQYNLSWTASSVDVVAGIGWQPGSAQ